jgi:hypothetical protein
VQWLSIEPLRDKAIIDRLFFTENATLEFLAFVQTKANRGANQLKKLHLQSWSTLDRLGIALMLTGSALHTLDLGRHDTNVQVLFENLVAHETNIRLRCLLLTTNRLRQKDLIPLERYLAQTSTLRDLRIVLLRCHRELQILLPAFRANGSLVRVGIMDYGGKTHPLTFRSFCARNAKLPMLMRAYDADRNNDADQDGDIGMPPLSLAPALFALARQTPRTAANITLKGLLALSDSLGSVRSDKLRMRY